MNKLDILLNALMLLYRETELKDKSTNSVDLVKDLIKIFKSKHIQLNGGLSTIINDVITLINDFINHPTNYDLDGLLNSLKIILKEKPDTYIIYKEILERKLDEDRLKKSLITLRSRIKTYTLEEKIKSVINKISFKINSNTNVDIIEETENLLGNLQPLVTRTEEEDPGIVSELDISDEDNVSKTLNKAKTQLEEGGKLLSGWKELNVMTQNGFRRGEMWTINALQHKYKSGFTQSLFAQICMHNTPVNINKDKKPLNVYISFEDDDEIYTTFIYKYLYYNEFDKLPDLTEITAKDMALYIKEKLTKTGYHVKMLRVNPSEWTYMDIQNKILEYESQGYEVHALFIDYLSKLPTTGCLTNGPMGTDVRDMFNRIRNFISSKSILCITPHQLSTEAKQLIRNGVTDTNFVKEIAGKGYTEGSKQLDQVLDGEIYIHIARIKRKPYLTVQRGKHRTPGILDDKYMYFTLPFPPNAPIKSNIEEDGEPKGFDGLDSNTEDSFDF